ncbi:hypothetical protein Vadar_026465 [Vaccinium darrowii]|uniref:Uncharacterized protein n=1 Tax=Vaccinium darrowii TaxID=229202 RepID=A0ACB7YZI0_9ERIC|nr:hypothetical protein Vadar_026465 [Vaccinium darrowii]
MSFFVENFKLLRVLSFISTTYQEDIDIGHLVHLRYLALQSPKCEYAKLPFSYFLNLETLNLHSSIPCFFELPQHICKMVKLRHLYTKKGISKTHYIDYHSSKLESLQTLHRICHCRDCRKFLVTRTPHLRKLGVYGKIMSKDGVLMLPNLELLKCLETLSFTDRFSGTRVASTLPAGLKLPPTVTRLTLKDTFLKWEELSILQTLPSLEKWNASTDQFRGLEILALRGCKKLEGIPIDFANLSELHEIKMEQCSRSANESAREIQEEQKYKRGDDDCLNLLARANLF